MQRASAMSAVHRTPRFWFVLADRVIPLCEGVQVVGRSVETDVCFPEDSTMSRSHARLEVSAEHVMVEDLESANGTWVNGHKLRTRESIKPGDRVLLGNTELVLHAVGLGVGRDDTSTTSPEIPAARAVRAAKLVGVATQRNVDLERGLLDVERAIEERRLGDARRHFDEYIAWLDVAAERADAALVLGIAKIALKFAVSSREGAYADWVSSTYRRLRRPIDAELVALAQMAADRGVPFDYRAFDVKRPQMTEPVIAP